MKKTLFIILLISIAAICFAQTSGDYRVRSGVTTGNWNSQIWQKYTTSWADVTTMPTYSDGVITIASGKTITIGGTSGANVTADQLVVSGTLIVDEDFVLTIAAGSGTDLSVTSSGTLSVNGTVTVNSSATASVNGTAKFNGGDNAGKIDGSGSFTLASGATLDTKNTNGISSSGSTGSIQTTTRSFSSSANYKYTSGDGAQSTGSGLPSPVNKLTVQNPYGLNLTSALTITTQLIFVTIDDEPCPLYIQTGDLTMGASATVSGTSNIGFKGAGELDNLEYVDYLSLFVNDSDMIPATIGQLIVQATPVIPNDFEVNTINFNGSYFDLNHKKVTFTNTDAAFKGDSDVYSLGVTKSETSNTFQTTTSIARTWTTYSDHFTNTLELQLSYPEELLSSSSVRVWKRLSSDVDVWTLVGNFTTTGTEMRTVSISGLDDIGTYDATLDWTITGVNETLPVELSSFSALSTPQNYSMLQWTTQSETSVSGYYLFRNETNDILTADRINAFIPALNTSQEANYSFVDREAQPGYTWYYWLQHIDMNGETEFHGPINITLYGSQVETPIIPVTTSLQQAYPNPFNPSTTISYGLSKPANVNLVIYNSKGERVKTLFTGQKAAGIFRINWEGKNDNGRSVPTGMYFVKMTADKYSSSLKLILMK